MNSKSRQYATEQDLAWFQLKKYAGLKNASFAIWAEVIAFRVLIEYVRRTLPTNEVIDNDILYEFEKIKSDPILLDVGPSLKKFKKSAKEPTPTIRPLTVTHVRLLHHFLSGSKLGNDSLVDTLLQLDPNMVFVRQAHVIVDMNASQRQILADFSTWFKAARKDFVKIAGGDYRTKVESWANSQLVPYMDLELFTLVTGKKISIKEKASRLFPRQGTDVQIAQNRRLLGLRNQVFTEKTVRTLRNLAKSESANLGK